MKNQIWKDVAAVFVILFLLPYIVTMIAFGIPKKDNSLGDTSKQNLYISYEGRQEKISLKEYLIGVLAAQIPIDYQMETLRAHTVLARTYYYMHIGNEGIVDSNHVQQSFLTEEQMKNLWEDRFEVNYKKLEQAVTDTGSKCMYYNEQYAEPYFHAVSAGKTRNGKEFFGKEAYDYMKSCECEKDLQADSYVTMKIFTQKEMLEYMNELLQETDSVTSESVTAKIEEGKLLEQFEIVSRDSADYVTRIKVTGQLVHGETFREALGLPSACFWIEEWESGIRFVCKGLGHGFGISLYSANELAKKGAGYEEILQYFFENIKIK